MAAGMEKAVNFRNDRDTIRGVLHRPVEPGSGVGMVFLHGWPGCRLGPHRMFVKTARRLARAGLTCLRFDFRGRGESEGATAQASIQSMVSDTRRAVDFMTGQCPELRTIVLLGICSGGKVAISEASADERVSRLVLWSAEPMGPLRSAATATRKSLFSLRSYVRKLWDPATWRKIFARQVNVRMVRKAVAGHEAPDNLEIARESRDLARFRSFRGDILFIYGSRDPDTRLAAQRYGRFCGDAGIAHTFHEIAEANHSFYSLEAEQTVIETTHAWLGEQGLLSAAREL